MIGYSPEAAGDRICVRTGAACTNKIGADDRINNRLGIIPEHKYIAWGGSCTYIGYNKVWTGIAIYVT